MPFQQFVAMIVVVIKRYLLHRDRHHRQMFFDLAPLLVDVTSGKFTQLWEQRFLANYATSLPDYVACVNEMADIPRGCRFGRLDFSPILQLAKRVKVGGEQVKALAILPVGQRQLREHFNGLMGLSGNPHEPKAFKSLFGFSIADYAKWLDTLMVRDPTAYVMLVAHEFCMAKDRLAGSDMAWLDRGATIAELGRLIEIVRHLDGRPERVQDIRLALRGLLRPKPTKRGDEQKAIKAATGLINQFGYGVEALRALFLGDCAGPAIMANAITGRIKVKNVAAAVARCAWFANETPVDVRGFRTIPKRFVRRRSGPAYTYYGITLDKLLLVGLKDLANARGCAGGVHSLQGLADEIADALEHGGDYRKATFKSGRDACTSEVYAELYLREAGRGGAATRFNPDCWLATTADDALYERLWRMVQRAGRPGKDGRPRDQIEQVIGQLTPLIDLVRARQLHLFDPALPRHSSIAAGVMTQLACGLTPIAMDPIFAALVERGLVERGFRHPKRKNPIKGLAGPELRAIAQMIRSSAVWGAFARFEGVDGRINHDPSAALAEPLIPKRVLPMPLREVAR